MITRLRNYFLTGFIVTAPLAITAYLAWSMVGWVDSWVKPYIPARYNPDNYLPFAVPGFGLIVALVLITFIGFMTANFIGRTVVSIGENLLHRLPLVRSVYRGLKQILETVLSERSDMFKKVGLIEYPRKGLWALVFVATETRGEVQAQVGSEAGQTIAVFLPTTPNPTSGYLLFVPKEDVIELKMTVEEGAKLVISAGLVAPEYQAKTKALAEAAIADMDQPARSSRTASSRPNR